MLSWDDTLKALREAVGMSPQNIPLRKHLAETLLQAGHAREAEDHLKQIVSCSPNDDHAKTCLARAYYQQDKNSHAFVIVEELLKRRDTPAAVYLLHARLLLRAGDIEQAVRQYKQSVHLDPDITDPILEEQLGIGAEARGDVVEGKLRAAAGELSEEIPSTIERPTIGFNQVGGMEEVKDDIRMKIIYPLQHAEMFKAYNKPIGGGILLYGPPGCGKTHIARATAGEIQAGFIVVGINDVLDMWIGNSERNLHGLFEQARASRPCVLFFDEVDALGASRSDMRQSAGRHLINQFLSEMDGMSGSNEGVLILGATNAPWHLDSAFRRPGRFDRIVFVPPPDPSARTEILRILVRDKPVTDVDYSYLAKKTPDYSGADLKAVVDAAIENKLREALKRGTPQPLTTKDLAAALKVVRPSTQEWFSTARNYALYSNQAGVYDDILKYMGIKKP